MIKIKLIELIQERLNKGSVTPDIYKGAHPLVIQEYIGLAFNSIIYATFKKNPEGIDIYGKWFYDQEVKKDGDVCYCDLPVSTMQLPRAYSVLKITKVDDVDEISFLPARVLASSAYGRLGVIERSGTTIYSVTNKILFKEIDPSIEKVNIFQVVPFADMNENDEVPVPGGQDSVLIDSIMEYFNDNRINDRNSNNNGH
jgi:hypothetical protein